MQNLVVLATGQRRFSSPGNSPANEADGFTTITVEVRPEQAKKLVLAQRTGRLTALLRNPADDDALNDRMIALEDLLGQPVTGRQIQSGPRVIIGGLGPIQLHTNGGNASQTPPTLLPGSGVFNAK